jgi:hypothetical protein
MSYTLQTLTDIQFQQIGEWKLDEEALSIVFNTEKNVMLQIPNVLYSFVLHSKDNSSVIGYIGKTSKSVKNRFQGYLNPGINQRTNIRVSQKIKESLKSGHKVFIHALFDIEPLQWGGFSINLPAGLEDALVNKLKPIWNIAGTGGQRIITSTEELEEEIVNPDQNPDNIDDVLTSFKIKLGEAYYNQGFMNPGVKASDYLGDHNEQVILILPGGKELKSRIDRNANPNGSVRIYFGQQLSNWFQQNYRFGGSLTASVRQKNRICIE